MRQLCAVLALAATVAATDIASAQQFNPVARDIRTGVYRGQLVTYEVVDGLAIWDGDIILGTAEELSPAGDTILDGALHSQPKLSSVSDKRRHWPGGIIPYVIDLDLTNPHVPAAIRHWEENTPIRFVERTNQPNWVLFQSIGGCSAYVGMIGGEQTINLHANCDLGTVIHEIGHATGLWHEQQRNDRDHYIFVNPDLPRYYHPFGSAALDSGPYDYGSVMHYRCRETMVTIPPGLVCGANALSAGDIDSVNRLYGNTPTETTITTNPAGLLIEVDGETYTAPHSFDWALGSKHTIGVPVLQKFEGEYLFYPRDHHRFIFAKWSDGGAQTHSVTASSETTVFIANFILQARNEHSAFPPQSGTVKVDPPSSDGFYTRFSFIKVLAEPTNGFSFNSWSGLVPGFGPASNPQVITSGKHNKQAFFTGQTLTKIDTNVPGSKIVVDGGWRRLPDHFPWEAGSIHTLGLPVREDTGYEGVIQPSFGIDGERLVFDGWSDGGAETHDITISEEHPTITAYFRRQVVLDTGGSGSTITVDPPGSDDGYHDLSSTVWLTAQQPGREFVSWLGDLSGSENPKPLLMDSPKRVTALFMDWGDFRLGKIVSGKPISMRFGTSFESRSEYWIVVPKGATKLEVHLETDNSRGSIDLYVNYGSPPFAEYSPGRSTRYESTHLVRGTSRDKSIVITPELSPPLRPGPYFIKVHQSTSTGRAQGRLRVDLTVAEAEIATTAPHYGIRASLITTQEGEIAPPQILEVRNSGRGTLDYEIATDQPWLSVSPDQGSAREETDIIEIRADPMAMEPGTFKGTITITERQPAEGFAGLFSDHTPAWPVTVPVTFIVIPESWETTPTIPQEDESENDEQESGGLAVETRLRSPQDVTVDAAGNLYIAEYSNHRIRRVDSSGMISTFAGTGERGFSGDGGPAVEARLGEPKGVAVDAAGNLFFVDGGNRRIRKVDSSGTISTFAGTGESGFGGDGGPAVEAKLNFPADVTVDAAGNLFIADRNNLRIRKVDSSGIITTIAGVGFGRSSDGEGGPAVEAYLFGPDAVAVDAAGNLFFTETGNHRVRRVDLSGIITTIAGTGESGFDGDGSPATAARFKRPRDLAVDGAGSLYIADTDNHLIRKVDSSGTISTVAGTGESGFDGDGGPAVDAHLTGPRGVAVDAAGNLFIADSSNHRIRKVDPSGTITTVAGSGDTAN